MKINYFKFLELVHSNTALEHGILNLPTKPQQVSNLYRLWIRLNKIRHEVGLPIYVNSAFRVEELNTLVGGVPNSFHLQGRAADIRCDDMAKLKDIVMKYELSEYCDYGTFIHIAI